jgi:hypothetical protein
VFSHSLLEYLSAHPLMKSSYFLCTSCPSTFSLRLLPPSPRDALEVWEPPAVCGIPVVWWMGTDSSTP